MEKVTFFITGMNLGGAERVMATLANRFVLAGYQVNLVTLKKAKSKYQLDDEINFIGGDLVNESTLRGKLKNIIKSLFIFREHIKKENPDVVISFLTNSNLVAVIAKKLFRLKCKIIISERADPRERSKLLQMICCHIYAKADLLICQSEVIKKYFYDRNTNTKIDVIENPINTNAVYTGHRSNHSNKIMCVGRLDPQKNFEMVLRALKLVTETHPNYELEIFGEGPSRNSLQLLAHELNLTQNVVFKGAVTNVFSKEGNVDLFVMSSNYEGFPNALVEAMASGIPVISTRFPTGVAETLISEGENGYLVNLNDHVALADKMVKILENSALREKMSENNKKILTKLNLDSIFLSWEAAIYKENN